jgi:hypothetical protein
LFASQTVPPHVQASAFSFVPLSEPQGPGATGAAVVEMESSPLELTVASALLPSSSMIVYVDSVVVVVTQVATEASPAANATKLLQ